MNEFFLIELNLKPKLFYFQLNFYKGTKAFKWNADILIFYLFIDVQFKLQLWINSAYRISKFTKTQKKVVGQSALSCTVDFKKLRVLIWQFGSSKQGPEFENTIHKKNKNLLFMKKLRERINYANAFWRPLRCYFYNRNFDLMIICQLSRLITLTISIILNNYRKALK